MGVTRRSGVTNKISAHWAKGEFYMYGNVLVSFGGGLIDCALQVILRIAKNLSEANIFDKIFIGEYSFESFYNQNFLHLYNKDLIKKVKGARGTRFGTCRGINLTDPTLLIRSIQFLKANNITTIIVVGGDGSSRQVAEISAAFKTMGINIIFAIPLTIDGINGGKSIGMIPAVRESVRQTENMVSTSLMTRDNEKFGVVAVELQGRNRDDIMANVLLYFIEAGKIADIPLTDILLRVIPANIPFDEGKLINQVNNSLKPTLLLSSEGSGFNISNLKDKVSRKVRTAVVGHASQSNNMTTNADIEEYNLWIDEVSKHIISNPTDSYSLVMRNNKIMEMPIDYYAVLNPRENQLPEMDAFLIYWLKKYMA